MLGTALSHLERIYIIDGFLHSWRRSFYCFTASFKGTHLHRYKTKLRLNLYDISVMKE
jgi:hypothetical protein